MDFAFTEEHEELRGTVRKFLERQSSEAAVRELMTTERGYDPAAWTQMAQQMGLQGLIVPEQHGGVGLGPVEMAIVLEEMGRALLCAPFFSSAVLTPSVLAAADEATRADLLPGIASGETLATVAFVEDDGRWDLDAVAMRAEANGSGWRLSGCKHYVLDGHTADVIIVIARTDDGLSLFRIDGNASGVERELLPTLDLTRKLARITFAGAVATRIGGAGDLRSALDGAFARVAGAIAAEQLGGAQRCLELSTEYAKTRLQFGRPIGSFQAIKHRCADMMVEVEFARSAAYHAAFAAAGEIDDDLVASASIAKAYCSDAFFRAAGDTIQIHGGMGFTWEHPAHLYFKRAKSSAMLFGDALQHRERLAAHLGL